MFKDKAMNKYALYSAFIVILIGVGLYWFSDMQYKNIQVKTEKELSNYSNVSITEENNSYATVSAEDKTGQKVKFLIQKTSPLYEKVYLLESINTKFLNETNILKLLLMLIIFAVVTFYIFKGNFKFKNNKETDEEKGKSKASSIKTTKSEHFEVSHSNVKFSDVASYDYVKEEFAEILDQIKNPHKYSKLGAKLIKGAILSGPPGTGKTFFAKAVAGEAGVPFISANGTDFVNEYVGRGAKTVRELFDLARQNAPCIIFIDEIDALGSERTGDSNNKEYDNTVNALLVELQGFKSDEHIVVFGATNKPEQLDQALMRPGRMDRKIEIGLPDQVARLQILKHLISMENRKFAKDCDFQNISSLTYNFSAAELDSLINEAILLTARKSLSEVTNTILLESFDKVSMGIKSQKTLNKDDKKIVAYHEAGHAVMTKYLKPKDVIQKVTILPTGNALGFVQKTNSQESYLQTKENLIHEIHILLAGRVAEEVFCKVITTGAENDLKVATNILADMMFKAGMFDVLAYQDTEINYDMINKELKAYYQKVKSLFEAELNNKVDKVAKSLLQKEVINGTELEKLMK